MIKRILLVLALFLGLGIAIPASPAFAAGCASGTFCIHKQASLNPYWVKTPPETPAATCVTVSPQDYTRYVTNRTNYIFDVWLTGSCSGTRSQIWANTEGPMDATWSDRIRSVARRSSATLAVPGEKSLTTIPTS